MDLDERIERRLRASGGTDLVTRWPALNPAVHLDEPVGRGPVLERVLDALSPLFEGRLPENTYIYGPPGSGKSAVVTALLQSLDGFLSRDEGAIQTTTRAASEPTFGFAYVDSRTDGTPFRMYRTIVGALRDERVPKRGVGTDQLRERLVDELTSYDGVVVAVDHVDEPGTPTLDELADVFEPFVDGLSWVAVGRTPPDSVRAPVQGESVHIGPYRQHTLVDILTTRASRGIRQGITHEQARRIATWADGDAQNALAGLFGAAALASDRGHEELIDIDVTAGMNQVPTHGVPIARVIALPENRQRVLDHLLDLKSDEARTIEESAAAIAERCDLTEATVTRFLYELAEDGILARVRADDGESRRGPSRVEPRFPILVYRRLRGD